MTLALLSKRFISLVWIINIVLIICERSYHEIEDGSINKDFINVDFATYDQECRLCGEWSGILSCWRGLQTILNSIWGDGYGLPCPIYSTLSDFRDYVGVYRQGLKVLVL